LVSISHLPSSNARWFTPRLLSASSFQPAAELHSFRSLLLSFLLNSASFAPLCVYLFSFCRFFFLFKRHPLFTHFVASSFILVALEAKKNGAKKVLVFDQTTIKIANKNSRNDS